MAGQSFDTAPPLTLLQRTKDLLITLILWGYFTIGFCLIFAPIYLLAMIFAQDRQRVFQWLNSFFFKSFFTLCRTMIPNHRWHIDPQVRRIRGAIILCNHISYLDSILMVSLYPQHTTIAKARLFNIPLFGRNLDTAGYIPSTGEGRLGQKQQQRLERLPDFLSRGGNLFLFPEGTRSRNGRIGPLQKGGFKIARMCKATIQVVSIRKTQRLFEPGRFLFHTNRDNIIEVKLEATLNPDYDHPDFSIDVLMQQVIDLMAHKPGSLNPP